MSITCKLNNNFFMNELTKHNKLCNGMASPHLVCGWLRHLIRKPNAANPRLNKGVMFLSGFDNNRFEI